MQSSSDITRQIDQVEREVKDIQGSLKRLTHVQDLLDAHGELTNRANVLSLLQQRLEDAQEREARQAELDKKRALEKERDDAKAEHDRLTAEFEAVMVPLEQAVLDALDRLDPLAFKRMNAETQRSNAAFVLRGRTVDWSNADKLSTGAGWYGNTEGAGSPVRRCLFELYAARHGMPGRLELEGQESQAVTAHRAWLLRQAGTQQPRQDLTAPNTALDESLQFLDERMGNRDD